MSEMLLTAYDGAILGPIAKVLGWLMNGTYTLMQMIGLDNVGLSIIIFTIIIYTLMFPLTYKQQKFSKMSQKMQPELQAINKKYQGKKDQASMIAMQEETQAIYQKYGVSMMGSCLQMLIQMPLLFALYRVFMNVPAYVTGVKDNFTAPDESAVANSIVDVLYKLNSTGWDALKDAFPSLSDNISSTYEAVSHVNNFVGMNISDTPWHIITSNFSGGHFLLVIAALMIPLVSYISQIASMKLMTSATANNTAQGDAMAQQMNMMNKVMPLFSLVMCFTVPVGLGIYWIISALVRVVQQFLLNKHFDKIDMDDIIKKNQEKAKKKLEKMGISENQISNAARMNTKRMTDVNRHQMISEEQEAELEKVNEMRTRAKAGSMTAKANMVRDFNERNSRK